MASINYFADAAQLEKQISNILEDVIDAVAKNLLRDFRQHLDETIYSPRPTLPYEVKNPYKRLRENGGFYSGWDIAKTRKLIRKLCFDENKLAAPSYDNGLAHGGRNEDGDIRSYIAEVLNSLEMNADESYWDGAYYLSEYGGSIGYWDSYLIDIDDKVEKWLDDEFKKYGATRG